MIAKGSNRLVLAIAAITTGGVLRVGTASAQEDVTSLGLEEIVVTAQKREEDLQSVPISISALNASDIDRRGVHGAADLLSSMPNMSGFISPGSRGDLAITMRGVPGSKRCGLGRYSARSMVTVVIIEPP